MGLSSTDQVVIPAKPTDSVPILPSLGAASPEKVKKSVGPALKPIPNPEFIPTPPESNPATAPK